MGKIKDKVFGLVVSKNVTDSLADSIKDNNQAKFYLAQTDKKNGVSLDNVTTPKELIDRNVLIINGNKIQGVNTSDLNKLDAITDVSKLFVYKGSVSPSEFKALSAYDVDKGDVYNVTGECEVNEIKYPAYTNFICINVSQLGPQTSIIEWDSLGGTMQMGTSVAPTVNDSKLSYKTTNNIPISSFEIVLGSDTGIVANAEGVIRIKSDRKIFSRVEAGMLSCNSAAPLNHITLHISTGNGLFIGTNSGGNNCIDLHLSTETTCYMSTNVVNEHTINNSLRIVSSNDYPLHEFILPCGNGVEAIITDNIKHTANLVVKLSTSETDTEVAGNSRMSGLDFSDGGLYVALSSSEEVNKKFLIRNKGGLALKYTELVNSLMTDTSLRIYIGSLINDVLKAQ